MKALGVLLFLTALGWSQGNTCDALDDIMDYLNSLASYGSCSRNSDCNEIMCSEDERGDLLYLKVLPCRSTPAIDLRLDYANVTYVDDRFTDGVYTRRVTVDSFTFDVIIRVRDRNGAMYIEVQVQDVSSQLVVAVIPYTKIPRDCRNVALIVGLTVGLVGGFFCCVCACVCVAAFAFRQQKRKKVNIKLDELRRPLSPELESVDEKTIQAN